MSAPLPDDFEPIAVEVQDELWLNMDRPTNLMYIDSLILLDGKPDWKAVKRTLRDRMVEPYPTFRCRPEHANGRSQWVPDPDFRLSRHLKKARLAGGHTEESLRRFVAAERSKAFDPNHPLWVAHLVDEVVRDDGRTGAAILLRVHHSLADGIRMTELALSLCDPVDGTTGVIAANVGKQMLRAKRPTMSMAREAMSSLAETGAARLAKTADTVADVARSARGAVLRDLRDPLGAPGRVASSVGELASVASRQVVEIASHPSRTIDIATYVASLAPGGQQASNTLTEVLSMVSARNPESTWTGSPGLDKVVVWSEPIELAGVVRIARASRATVNDVLVAAIAGAIMRYLADHETTLEEVGWLIPVSLQPFGQGAPERLGNHLALVNFRMPLSIADPKKRIQEIKRRTGRIKNSQETLVSFGIQRAIAQAPHTMSVWLTNYFANLTVGVLTNVPGPRQKVSFAGTVVDAMLGWAPSSGDQPMTVCIYSYAGQVRIALAADAGLIPDAQRIIDHLHAEVAAMKQVS